MAADLARKALSNEEMEALQNQGSRKPLSNEEMQQKSQPSEHGLFETALTHGANGASLGFLPQIAGIAAAQPHGGPNAFDIPEAEEVIPAYKRARDSQQRTLDEMAAERPKTAFVSELAGSFANPIAPKGKGFIEGAVGGAKLGALAGLGNSRTDLTEGEFGQALEDIGKGATIGAGVGGALGKLQTLGKDIKKARNDFALKGVMGGGNTIQNRRSIQNVTKARPGSLQSIEKREDDVINSFMDRKPGQEEIPELGWMDKTEDIAHKLNQGREFFGKQMDAAASAVDSLAPVPVSAKEIADRMRKVAAQKFVVKEQPTPEGTVLIGPTQHKAYWTKINEQADDIEAMGQMTFGEAQKIKDQFKYKASDKDAHLSDQDILNAFNQAVGEVMDGTVERMIKEEAVQANPQALEALQQWRNAKTQWGHYAGLEQAAVDRRIKNKQLNRISLTGAMSGIGAATAHMAQGHHPDLKTLLIGVGTAAGVDFLKKHGDVFAAKALDSALRINHAIRNLPPEQAQKILSHIADEAASGNKEAVAIFALLNEFESELNQMERAGGRSEKDFDLTIDFLQKKNPKLQNILKGE